MSIAFFLCVIAERVMDVACVAPGVLVTLLCGEKLPKSYVRFVVDGISVRQCMDL